LESAAITSGLGKILCVPGEKLMEIWNGAVLAKVTIAFEKAGAETMHPCGVGVHVESMVMVWFGLKSRASR
jgi:hypothetical protein